MTETVNHPEHYNKLGAKTSTGVHIECIDVVRCMSFNIGNAVKYLWRADEKGAPLEDLRKAVWYIEDELRRRCDSTPQPADVANGIVPTQLQNRDAKGHAKKPKLQWLPAVGDKVVHTIFGHGTVTLIDDNRIRALTRVVVKFPSIGAKEMTWAFCRDKLRPA